MCFLVPDIGHEDILLSYPWLATFGPKFNWNNTIIEANALPIIFLSTHPNDTCTVIPSSQTEEEKLAIMKQLSKQTTIQGITTELAIKAGEWKRKTKIPKLYKQPPTISTLQTMGPCHCIQTKHSWHYSMQSLSNDTNRRLGAGRIHQGAICKGLYMPVKATICIILLFYQEEGGLLPH